MSRRQQTMNAEELRSSLRSQERLAQQAALILAPKLEAVQKLQQRLKEKLSVSEKKIDDLRKEERLLALERKELLKQLAPYRDKVKRPKAASEPPPVNEDINDIF